MVAAASSSPRRFDIDSSNQPILQFIATTVPFAMLCLWFLYSTARRPYIDCYQPVDNVTDDTTANTYSEHCSKYVPLKQFAIVFLLLAVMWGLLVAYLLLYVPRRHRLIREYLETGTTIIGDVIYNRGKKGGRLLARCSARLQPAYGYAVYPQHPNSMKDGGGGENKLVRRRVRVFERYTRERAAIVMLPNHPYSGQPKVDLEIDREVSDLNQRRLQLLSYYAIGWLCFCLVAPIFVVETMRKLDHGSSTEDDNNNDPPPWQPDIDIHNFPSWYYLASFVVMPVVVLFWTMAMWYWHRRWMTYQHQVITHDDVDAVAAADYYERQPDESTGHHHNCCFDDEECESIEIKDYQPPQTKTMTREDSKREMGTTV
jgi:hypothetical protein